MPHSRPDPDALLRRVQEEEARVRRGQLKVFLGASPGVGKTYTMLEVAQAKRAEGLDVVVGLVETHGRPETARLLQDLEILPRKTVEYRGARLEEFDLDAALQRHPALLLVDELAHTNVAGSRHAKRWQDVAELLEAGINVYTTMNIQHLESLNDVVAQITRVQVRETVPDSLLERADEIELVDVTADVLQQRLREGKVYIPEQATRAIERFFRKGNLIALRELALRLTAERVDQQMRGYMAQQGIRETWATAERLLVCLGPDANATRLVRATRRMATRMHADWTAVHVETLRDQRLTPAEREDLRRAVELAEELGARTVTLSGQSEAEEVLAYARAHNVTTIVVGKPRRPRWREVFRGSLLDALVRGSGSIEVLTLAGEGESEQARPVPPPRPSPAREYAKAIAIVLVPTILGLLLRRGGANLPPIDAAMLYLLAVVVASSRYSQRPSAVAALVGIASFDLFFVPPYYTFSVSDVRYVLTFGVMLLVALVMGNLTGRIRGQAAAAREREQRTTTLYGLSRDLATARTEDEVVAATTRSVRDTFPGDTAMFLPDSLGRVEPQGPVAYPYDDHERTVAQWSYDHGEIAGYGTTTLPGAAATYLPLTVSQRRLAVLGIRPANPDEFRDPARRRLLEALAAQAAAALERLALAERSRATEVEVEAEHLRTALLSSLSHDMRTPLASIEGSASALLQDPDMPDQAARRELASTILQESRRMNRLVANLLDMIRLETGALQVQKEWQPLSDVAGVALLRTEDRLKGHQVRTNFSPDLPLLPVDEILLEQVFVNLLENAAKYTPPGTLIEVGAEERAGEVVAYVADRGPGIPPDEEELVFRKFHRGGSGSGIGLGLTIARGIITAHGGRIWAENRPGGGAVFRFTLPIVGTPPPIPAEEPEGKPLELEIGSAWTAPPPSSS
jgi:two-component system sensor histidine kinase KdpD